ncbi:MAG TPA: alpha/beta fold hydrolase [Ktedonobacterales bacterium]|nr:alpha/beta fold hydrolase [Ktedonobacterales bacterium]
MLLTVAIAVAGCGAAGGAARATPTTAIPTLAQPTATLAVPSHAVEFTTPDGLRLRGTLYSSGTVGVALAHQSDGTQNQWSGFARQLAAHGYMALTFDFRGHNTSEGPADTAKEDIDLRAAIRFLRAQGATRIALMGASLGGAVALRVAATESVVAVATLSAVAWWTTQPVTDEILKAVKAPKLFINSTLDDDAGGTQHMYDVASPPKEVHIYPGRAHGVGIFSGDYGSDLIQRLLTFMATYAPTK